LLQPQFLLLDLSIRQIWVKSKMVRRDGICQRVLYWIGQGGK